MRLRDLPGMARGHRAPNSPSAARSHSFESCRVHPKAEAGNCQHDCPSAEGAVGPRPLIIRSICRRARPSRSPVPGSGRERSEVATIRSSGVRSARSSPAAFPRSRSVRRAVRTSAWRLRVAGVKTGGPPCKGSTKRLRSRKVAKSRRRRGRGWPRRSVPTRTSPAPPLSDAERDERLRRAIALAPEYGMEVPLPPAT
ncbi:hypothetical protein FAIPA1_210076 [Frankia sp. AiPs1]